MSLAAWNCAALVTCAAVLAVARADIDAAHRPIAALLAVWMLDPVRPVDGSALADVWAIALPVASASAAMLVLGRSRFAALSAALLVATLGAGSPLLAVTASILVQGLAALDAARRRLDLSDRCCLVLLAGDVAALGGPLGDHAAWPLRVERWWIVQWQGALVAAVLVAMHLHARRARA